MRDNFGHVAPTIFVTPLGQMPLARKLSRQRTLLSRDPEHLVQPFWNRGHQPPTDRDRAVTRPVFERHWSAVMKRGGLALDLF